MRDFLDGYEFEIELKERVNIILNELVEIPLREILVKSDINDWFVCPICHKKIVSWNRFVNHYRWKKNQWEFRRMVSIIERGLWSLEMYQELYKRDTELNFSVRYKLKLWAYCKKMVFLLNPRSDMGFNVIEKSGEIQSTLF
jgi:hypothetical protein